MAGLWPGVALFFLLFTAADLLSPGVCAEELLGFPPGAGGLLADAGGRLDPGSEWSIESEPNDPQAPDRPSPAHADEDCFCCCAHLEVGTHYSFEVGPDAAPQPAARAIFLPSRPSRSPFRPPRSSSLVAL